MGGTEGWNCSDSQLPFCFTGCYSVLERELKKKQILSFPRFCKGRNSVFQSVGLSCAFVLFPYMTARAKANLSHDSCQTSGGHLIDLMVSYFTTDEKLGLFQMKFKGRALNVPGPVLICGNK